MIVNGLHQKKSFFYFEFKIQHVTEKSLITKTVTRIAFVSASISDALFFQSIENHVQADSGGVLDAVARTGRGRVLFQSAGQVDRREENRVATVDRQGFHLNRFFDDGRFIWRAAA